MTRQDAESRERFRRTRAQESPISPVQCSPSSLLIDMRRRRLAQAQHAAQAELDDLERWYRQ